MQVINAAALEAVSGAGPISVTVELGPVTIETEFTVEEFWDTTFGIYDTWVDWTSDAFMWIDDTWSSWWY
jgi:hypothetical protein